MNEYQKRWKAFEENEISHSVAHYLLAIADHAEDGKCPRAADIARTLDVSRAAVSLQLRALKDHDLVEVGDDNRIALTALGEDLVARIASKRSVLRAFLSEILGVDDATAESDACKIEHLISEESGAALVRFMTLLRSEKVSARQFLETFADLKKQCAGDGSCDFCVNTCLLKANNLNGD